MATYIDIDVQRRMVNGQPATVVDMLQTLVDMSDQPGRFLCLFRNEYTGQYKYADFQSDSTGDHTGVAGA
jgi:hypothetical protein